MNLVIALILNALALIITSKIIPGFTIEGVGVAVVAALVIGVMNTLIRPILSFLTAPINLVTLGLFSFVVNAVILYLASLLVPGFNVDGAIPAIAGAVVLALTASVLSFLVKEVKQASQTSKKRVK